MPQRCRTALAGFLAVILAGVALPASAEGQYFGRNQVKYDSFKFEVLQTEHFDIHFYPEEEAAVREAARMAERWYDRLSSVFGREFTDANCVIMGNVNVNSPLVWDGTMTRALRAYARANQAAIIVPFILGGAMGNVALSVALCLLAVAAGHAAGDGGG